MASSTLVIPTSYHKPTPSIRKSKLDTAKVCSEDELLKFFLHGSYDVQRGNRNLLEITENSDEKECIQTEPIIMSNPNCEDNKTKSRCMFEETYMINISVKQPDTTPSSKQIDVRIEKTPSDEKTDDDEVSSIFDEEENDEIDSVIFNDINSSTSETPGTKLTLADMINKTLTTMPTTSTDNLNKIKDNLPIKPNENVMKKITSEDEKLFKYLDYLKTKEESKVILK
jgi:hypothetical protein